MAWEITIQMSKFSTSLVLPIFWHAKLWTKRKNKWCYSVICAIPTLPPPMIPMPISSFVYALELEIPISPSRVKFSISCTLLSVLCNQRGDAIWDSASLLWWRGWRPTVAKSESMCRKELKFVKLCIGHRAQRECFCSRTNVLWGCAVLLTGNQSEMVRLHKKHTRNRNQDLFTEKTEQLS